MFFRRKKPKPAKAKAAQRSAAPKPPLIDVPGYKGPERRQEVRRVANERRRDVRWQPGGADRRQSHGRRKKDSAWMHH